jgi:hypothetical protein
MSGTNRKSISKLMDRLRSRKVRPMDAGDFAFVKLFTLIVLACLPHMIFGQNEAIPVSTNGLDGYWPLNGEATDYFGVNHGVVYGASPSEDRFGNENGSLFFDGNDYVAFTNSFFNGSSSVSQCTISTWIFIDQLPAAGQGFSINTKEGYWRTIGLWLDDQGRLHFGGSQPYYYFGINSSPHQLSVGVWNHFTNSMRRETLLLQIILAQLIP